MSSVTRSPSKGNPALWLVTAGAAVALGFFASAHSASQIGIPSISARAFGPSFDSSRSDLPQGEQRFLANPSPELAQGLTNAGRSLLRAAPLSTPALRAIGLGEAETGNADRATSAMLMASKVSRRDPVVQAWLIDEAARRGDLETVLSRYDSLLRTKPELRTALLERLASALAEADFGPALRPYLRADNPWFAQFVTAAAARPDASVRMAQALLSVPGLPAGTNAPNAYRNLVKALVGQGEYPLLARLYPRLPGTGQADLGSLALPSPDQPGPYPPLDWALTDNMERGASLVALPNGKPALEARAMPLTQGEAAARVIERAPGVSRIHWRIVEQSAGRDAAAHWQTQCVEGGDGLSRSDNLLERSAASTGSLTLPPGCRFARISLHVFGGSSGDGAQITLADLGTE